MDLFSIILVGCLFFLALGIFINAISTAPHPESKEDQSGGYRESSFPEIPAGYYYHEMVGMYYRGITPKDFGVYDGYAIPEPNNKYDPYAVAIYRKSDNKHVGYIPAGNEDLFRTLIYRDKQAEAIFKIQGIGQIYYGVVYIKEDYKLFRKGNIKNPYLSRMTKTFDIIPNGNIEGRIKCWLTTKWEKGEYDYTVTAVDENGTSIAHTDDNQLQLFDYVENKVDSVPACCSISDNKGILLVPLNYTEKTINRKIEEFLCAQEK